MGRMLCLAIGISDAPPLDYLAGAANGARAFTAWATTVGYDTAPLLIDDAHPVGFEELRNALLQLMAGPERIDRLLLYFAGHGLARDAGEDLWLLSQWRDEQRAVAVGGLRRRLERFGVGQIGIFADACRSLTTDDSAADLTPDPVLGRGPYDQHTPRTDLFKASSRFRAAYMIPGATVEEDRCIFSGVLDEALRGGHTEAFTDKREPHCITSGSLARFLETEVPRRAAVYGVELNPEVTPGISQDDVPPDVYLAGRPAVAPTLAPWPAAAQATAQGVGESRTSDQRGWSTSPGYTPQPSAAASLAPPAAPTFTPPAGMIARARPGGSSVRKALTDAHAPGRSSGTLGGMVSDDRKVIQARAALRPAAIANTRDALFREQRPTHYETGAGASFGGTPANDLICGPYARGKPERDGRWWRIEPRAAGPCWDGCRLARPVPVLARMGVGEWVGAAALPNFVTTFSLQQGESRGLILHSLWGEPAFHSATAVAKMLSGGLKTEDAFDLAAEMRGGKHVDPVLGVLAAYLYDAQGDVDSIRQIAWFYTCRNEPVPFDIALLGRLPVRWVDEGVTTVEIPAVARREPRTEREKRNGWTFQASDAATGVVAGAFPWLRQGWALLEPDEGDRLELSPQGVAELAGELTAAPFTTLKPDAGKRLASILMKEQAS